MFLANTNPYLGGNLFFNLLLVAANGYDLSPGELKKEKGKTKFHSEPEIMNGLITVFCNEDKGYTSANLQPVTSYYKNFKNKPLGKIPFLKPTEISKFEQHYQTSSPDRFNEITNFVATFLDSNKFEWLVKVLIEIIINDQSISPNEIFLVEKERNVSKSEFISELSDIYRVEIAPFLLSVFHFIIINKRSAPAGQPTFDAWFEQQGDRKAHKLRTDLNLGASIKQKVEIVFPINDLRNAMPTELNEDTISENNTPFTNNLYFQQKSELTPQYKTSYFPDNINPSCFNLIVVSKENFRLGKISLSDNQVFPERYTEKSLQEKYLPLGRREVRELMTFPALFMATTNLTRDYSDYEQKVYLGFVDKITLKEQGIDIHWHYIDPYIFPMPHIRGFGSDLGFIDMEKVETEINYSHWSIKKHNLFRALKNQLLITLPDISINKKAPSEILEIELNESPFAQSGNILNPTLINYIYGTRVCERNVLVKTIQFPNQNSIEWRSRKSSYDYTFYVFDKDYIIWHFGIFGEIPSIFTIKAPSTINEKALQTTNLQYQTILASQKEIAAQLKEVRKRHIDLHQTFRTLCWTQVNKLKKDFPLLINELEQNKTCQPLELLLLSVRSKSPKLYSLNKIKKLYRQSYQSNPKTTTESKQLSMKQTECKQLLLSYVAQKMSDNILSFKHNSHTIKNQLIDLENSDKLYRREVAKLQNQIHELQGDDINADEAIKKINNLLHSSGYNNIKLGLSPKSPYCYEVFQTLNNSPTKIINNAELHLIAFLYFYFSVIGNDALDQTVIKDKIVIINDPFKDLDGNAGDLVSTLINDLVKRCANNISSFEGASASSPSDCSIKQIFILTDNVHYFQRLTEEHINNYNYVNIYQMKEENKLSRIDLCINSNGKLINFDPTQEI